MASGDNTWRNGIDQLSVKEEQCEHAKRYLSLWICEFLGVRPDTRNRKLSLLEVPQSNRGLEEMLSSW